MNFLNPIALSFGLLSGAIVLMYLLKLKRRREDFSSSLLWVRSVKDMTANAPFQKLRQNLLMYLQILMLLLAAFALARPTLWLSRAGGVWRIIMIDRTASMNALDSNASGAAGESGTRSRLAAAKLAARQLVANMRGGDQTMVLAFGGGAQVMQSFTFEKATLNRAIDSIEPSDTRGGIREAVQLALGARQAQPSAVLTLISDGGVGYLGDLLPPQEKNPVSFEFIGVGASDDNRGIVSFDVRRSFEHRDEIELFAEVRNYASHAADVKLRCLVNGQQAQVKEGTVEARGTMPVVFAGLKGGEEQDVRLELVGGDKLADDDVVEGIVHADTTTRILLVSKGNFFLERMLTLLPGARVSKIAPENFKTAADFDLVVFDSFAPPQLAPGRYMFINAVPPFDGFKKGEAPFKDQVVLDWNRLHPAMRFINFGQLAVGDALNITAPDWALPLVESDRAPLILGGEYRGTRLICIAFDIYATDWPLQVSFPVFISQSIQWLTGGAAQDIDNAMHKTGDVVMMHADGPVSVTGPDGAKWTLQPDDQHQAYFNQTRRIGLYEARAGDKLTGRFAVNLLAREESDITPVRVLSGGEHKIVASEVKRENREVWPWFAMGALAILTCEWHLYCRRSWL